MGSSILPASSPATFAAAEQTHTPTPPPPLNATGFQFHPPRHPPGCPLRGAQLPGYQSWLQPQSRSTALPKLRNPSASVSASVQWECEQQPLPRIPNRSSGAGEYEVLETQAVLGNCKQLLLSQPSESLETVPPRGATLENSPSDHNFPPLIPRGHFSSQDSPKTPDSIFPCPDAFAEEPPSFLNFNMESFPLGPQRPLHLARRSLFSQ